jgi:hypothetical protein
MQSRINILKVLKNKYWSSDKNFLLNFYKTFIRPLVDYANFPFIVANKTAKDSLQIKQNKILKICLNSDLLDSTDKIHELSKMDTLEQRQHQLSDKYLHKTLIINSNKIIIKTIKDQLKTDLEYTLGQVNYRQRKKTCLDNFITNNMTIIEQINL